VQENLEKIIAGKKSKAKPARTGKEAPEPTGDNVISIMDALNRSLAAGKR